MIQTQKLLCDHKVADVISYIQLFSLLDYKPGKWCILLIN